MTVYFALIEFLFWFTYGDVVNFASVYLLHCGVSSSGIGVLMALGCVLTVIAQPILSGYADSEKSISLKWIIIIPMVALICSSLALALTPGRSTLMTFVLYSISVLLVQLLIPFLNALGTESIRQGMKLNFSAARGIGSVGYAVMAFSMGLLFSRRSPALQPWTVIAAAALFIAALYFYPFKKVSPELSENAVEGRSSANPLRFFARYRSFSVALLGWVLLYVSHVFINNYTYQIVTAKGMGSTQMGAAMAIASLVELPTMFMFTFMLRKADSSFWFKLSGVFFTLKCLGTLLAWNAASFYCVQLLQLLGWGLISVASVYYVDSIMGPQDRIKGQSYMIMSYTVGTIIGSLLGGRLIDVCGVNVMLIVGTVAAAVGTVIVFCAVKKAASGQTSAG